MTKKLLSAFLALTFLFTLTACGAPEAGKNIEGSLEELLTKVTNGASDPEMALMTTQVNQDNFTWYFFIDPVEGAEGAVSEAAIGSIPHSIGLLRVPESADPEQVKKDIEAKLDPRKWVCVEAEKTAVIRHGDLILVAMSTADSVDKAVANFDALAK